MLQKIVMNHAFRRTSLSREGLKARLILQIHDELLVEVTRRRIRKGCGHFNGRNERCSRSKVPLRRTAISARIGTKQMKSAEDRQPEKLHTCRRSRRGEMRTCRRSGSAEKIMYSQKIRHGPEGRMFVIGVTGGGGPARA